MVFQSSSGIRKKAVSKAVSAAGFGGDGQYRPDQRQPREAPGGQRLSGARAEEDQLTKYTPIRANPRKLLALHDPWVTLCEG
jgi:hypothetical protein